MGVGFISVSVAQLVKTPDAAVLSAVAALVRPCIAWVRPQAKAFRNFSEDYFFIMDGKRRESIPIMRGWTGWGGGGRGTGLKGRGTGEEGGEDKEILGLRLYQKIFVFY